MQHQRTPYILIGIIILFIAALAVDASRVVPGFPAFAPGVKQGVDLQGGLRILYKATDPNVDSSSMTAARDILDHRINGLGLLEPVIQRVGNDRISIELPGVKDKDRAEVIKLLSATGKLTIQDTGTTALSAGAPVPAKTYKVMFSGADVKPGSGAVGSDPQTGAPVVDFQLQGSAVDRFTTYTADHVGQYMAIAMDGKVVTDPQIKEAIPSGSVQISGGNMTFTEANNIALQLKYGALPVTLKTVGIQELSATLGPANIAASVKAGLIGLLIVVLFMLIYYRLPGLLADVALLLYAALALAIFKLIGVTFTLAGIAGFILSIGMAVDANVLIFERMKEELRFGKTLGAAVDAGFRRAWTSIRDSNISTMLTCVILYWFGQTFAASVIVGFATTLFIGVAVSMFSAIFVTRTFLRVLIGSSSTRRSDSPTGRFKRSWFGAGL